MSWRYSFARRRSDEEFAVAGSSIALLSKHQKEHSIAPELAELGCALDVVNSFDTDRLGTFTRDVVRRGTQVDAARRKARLAVRYSNLPLGLGSEGAFGPDPITGVLPWNVEVLVLFDSRTKRYFQASAQGASSYHTGEVQAWEELCALAGRLDFPSQALVLRAEHAAHNDFVKGIDSWELLEKCYRDIRARTGCRSIYVETDMRAHRSPGRREMIRKAAANLVAVIRTRCPACDAEGYCITERLRGRPCRLCTHPTSELRAELWRCSACQHFEERDLTNIAPGSPERCPSCNP